MNDWRVGTGFDAHRFCAGDHVLIGGVRIPHDQGIEAHSDGDVLLHALCDAVLGAAALGDIGVHFPPGEDATRNLDSRVMLRRTVELAGGLNLVVWQVDATVIAQRPRLADHVAAMRENIATDLSIPADRVSVKATTTERMGFTGRGEGIAAQAVATLRAAE